MNLTSNSVLSNLAAVPHIEDAIPPTSATLAMLLAADPLRDDVALALATLYVSEGRLEDAVSQFKKLVTRSDSAVARCNLGIAYLLQERFSEAVVELSKSVLMDSSLVCAHLQLARAQHALGDLKAAKQALEKVVAYQPKNVEALSELAALYAESPSESEQSHAAELYRKALSIDADNEAAQIALGKLAVAKGVQAFERGEIENACSLWGAAYQEFPRVFSGDASTQQSMRNCSNAVSKKRLLPKALSALLQADDAARAKAAYRYVLLYLLSEGLVPECYHSFDALASQKAYWKNQTSADRIFPYAHYRYGIVCGYNAEFETAAHEVLYARDYLPVSKHRSLRVDEVSAFFREVREQLSKKEHPVEDESSVDAWVAQGFDDAFTQQAWRKAGCSPAQAAQWSALGVRAQDAADWQLQQIDVEAAAEWISSGITNCSEAKRWLRAGISPSVAAQWRGEFLDDVSTAVQCIQLGFADASEAKVWLAIFMFPYEAIAWRQSGFEPEEAQKWMRSGIKDPFLAKQQRDHDEAIFAAAVKEQEESSEGE